VELDIPVAIVGTYGHLQLPNEKQVESLISGVFGAGEVLTIHIVAESTGEQRAICKWVDSTTKYKVPCQHVCDSAGVCPNLESHLEKEREALQPMMELEA
jgi:hypothetical protein